MTTAEFLLARKLGKGDSPSIVVEALNVTENGTYTAPQGKAYTPVTVEVAPPEDSYQLKSITTPTSLATFEASALPMPTLKVSVEAKQDLHGYDHPWVGGSEKQMLDTARFIQRNGYNNLSVSVNGNVITFSGYTSGGRFGCFNVPTVVGETYTMKFTNITNAAQDSLGYIESDTEPTVWIGFGTIFAKNSATTITATKPWLQIYCEMTEDNATITNLMVEKGLTASPWEPYSNICPISGWTGVNITNIANANIWDEQTRPGYYDTSGNYVSVQSNVCNKNLIILPHDHNIRFISGSGYIGRLCWYDCNKSFISSFVPTSTATTSFIPNIPDNACYLNFDMKGGYGNTYNNDISINYPSTDHDYHAYNGVTTTISLPQTVYGGELDVVNGTSGNKLTHAVVDMGDLDWSYNANYGKFSVSIADKRIVEVSEYLQQSHLLCSILNPTLMIKSLGNDLPDMSICEYTSSTSSNSVIVRCSDYTDANAFKTAMQGQKICYELATPTTFETQPTPIKSLNGQNNLSVDTGDVIEGEYFIAL